MIDIFIPTYQRLDMKALALLKDPNVRINFCVRGDALDSGFYDKFIEEHKNDNINMLNIGYNVIDLGDTRQRILDHCCNAGIRYCVMFDDTVSDVYNLDHNKSISECIEECIEQMKENQELNVMYAFSHEQRKHHAQDINTKYFLHCPAQAFIIDTFLAGKHNITFKPLSICGIEDMAFFIDTIKEGLLTCTNRQINIIVETTLKAKKGGTHTDSYTVEKKCDIYNTGLHEYVGDMYGVYFTKRYRHQIEDWVCFAAYDYDYFIDVLIKYRHENQNIIDSKFAVKKEYRDED